MSSEESKSVDLYAPRTVVLINNLPTKNPETGEIEAKEVEFVHQTISLSDEIWLEFNRVLNPRRKFQNGKLEYKDDLRTAVEATYKKIVPEIPSGYQTYFRETLTLENFHDLIPYADKEAVLDQCFAFQISEAKQAFFFGEASEQVFEIDVPINGEAVTGKIGLQPITKKLEKDYKQATEPKTGEVRRFRNPEISTKPAFKKLSEVFEAVKSFDENFEIVPIWIRIGLVRYYFEEFGKSSAKN